VRRSDVDTKETRKRGRTRERRQWEERTGKGQGTEVVNGKERKGEGDESGREAGREKGRKERNGTRMVGRSR
jgi:hypothetical protein